jgi:heme A synthase
LSVAVFIFCCAVYAFRKFKRRPQIIRPILTLSFLVVLQIALGALTLWTQRGGAEIAYFEPVPLVTTLHQANGSLILGVSFLLCLRSFHLSGQSRAGGVAKKSLVEKKDYALQV